MIKRVLAILIGVLALISLTACQQTPEKEIVLGKDLDRVLDEAQNTEGKPEGPTLNEKLDIPETYTASLQDAKENLQVNVDAGFELPDKDNLPTAKVGMDTFSQGTADKLMELLLQGETLYELESSLQYTKADIEERLVELYAMRAGEIPVQVDGDLEESIKLWEQRLAEAPEEVEKIPAQITFHKKDMSNTESVYPLESYDYIEGISEIDYKPAYFTIQNQTQENRVYTLFTNSSETLDLMGGYY